MLFNSLRELVLPQIAQMNANFCLRQKKCYPRLRKFHRLNKIICVICGNKNYNVVILLKISSLKNRIVVDLQKDIVWNLEGCPCRN